MSRVIQQLEWDSDSAAEGIKVTPGGYASVTTSTDSWQAVKTIQT